MPKFTQSSLSKIFSTIESGKFYKRFEDVYFSPIHVKRFIDAIKALVNTDYHGLINVSSGQKIRK